METGVRSPQSPPQADTRHRKSPDLPDDQEDLLVADELVHSDTNQLVPGSGIDLRRRSPYCWGFSSDEEEQGHARHLKRSRPDVNDQSEDVLDSEHGELSVLDCTDHTQIPDTSVSSDYSIASLLDGSVNRGLTETDNESQFDIMDSMCLAGALLASNETETSQPEENARVVATLDLELSAQSEVISSEEGTLDDTQPPVSPLLTSSQLVNADVAIDWSALEDGSLSLLNPFDLGSQAEITEESINDELGQQFSLEVSLDSITSSPSQSSLSDQEVPVSSEDEVANQLEDETRRRNGQIHSCRAVPTFANEE